MGWDKSRDLLEITDLRQLLRLHGMQEVRGLSPLSSTQTGYALRAYVASSNVNNLLPYIF